MINVLHHSLAKRYLADMVITSQDTTAATSAYAVELSYQEQMDQILLALHKTGCEKVEHFWPEMSRLLLQQRVNMQNGDFDKAFGCALGSVM